MQSILNVKNLTKRFGEKVAVNNLSFSVEKGSLFAFLGQNGAGKTTTINMIIGLISNDGGEVLYDGSPDFSAYKSAIGIVFQNNILDALLTVEDNLLTYGTLYLNSVKKARARLKEVAELLSLSGFLKQRVSTLSGGQKRKAEIARALFTLPKILFLDEPTTGLDPKTRMDVWRVINQLRIERGMTVFLTTHYMEETAWADCVAIINNGELIATGSPSELKSKYTRDRLHITPIDVELMEKQLEKTLFKTTKIANVFVVEIPDAANSIDLLFMLKENIRFYEMIKGSMDDVFLKVVGETLTGEEALA